MGVLWNFDEDSKLGRGRVEIECYSKCACTCALRAGALKAGALKAGALKTEALQAFSKIL